MAVIISGVIRLRFYLSVLSFKKKESANLHRREAIIHISPLRPLSEHLHPLKKVATSCVNQFFWSVSGSRQDPDGIQYAVLICTGSRTMPVIVVLACGSRFCLNIKINKSLQNQTFLLIFIDISYYKVTIYQLTFIWTK